MLKFRKRLLCSLLLLVCLFTLMIGTTYASEQTNATTTIILARHGETDYNLEGRCQGAVDIPLNATGIKQAEALAESLKHVKIDVFIASPLQRAYVTTQKVAAWHGNPGIIVEPRLREINLGEWASQKSSDLKLSEPKKFPRWQAQPWKVRPPKGESMKEEQRRCHAALEDIVAKHAGKTIFIGAHSMVNGVILCDVMDIDIKHFAQISQDNTCINVLQYKNGQWKVLLMNSILHTGKLYKYALDRVA